jgi:hypothetical protein
MKCKLCGCDLNKEGEYDDELDRGIAEAHQNGICLNCWMGYKTTYYDYAHNITPLPLTKGTKKIGSSSSKTPTIEYLLICLECKHQTPYGYLWFAICDGREHVLSSGHKLVKISVHPQTSNEDYCLGYQHGFADTITNY